MESQKKLGKQECEKLLAYTKQLYQRRKLRNNFASFTEHILGEKPAKHHLLLIEKLEKVLRGETKRLMIFMPPGHAKSTYANQLFVPYYLGKNPKKAVISVGHTQNLAERFGRRARLIAQMPFFTNIFGAGVSPSLRSAGNWETEKGGEFFAIGVGGAVTGRRADLAIIDDPIKGREEADSELTRDKIWEWYLADLRTRLKPDAAIVLIQTRWHEDDLAGRILREETDEKWDVLCLKALADGDDPMGRDEGEALWPDWMPRDKLLTEKKIQTARNWSALYQQEPTPDEGAYFSKSWMRYYDEIPELDKLHIYGASDYAVSAGGGDYTVHGIVGVDEQDDIYILDWWRQQTSSDVWIEAFLDLVDHYKPLIWAEESGQIIKSLGPFIEKRQHERRIYCNREQFASTADKMSRARSIQARMAMGKVYFPRRKMWVSDLESEILSFPAGKHDDQIDVLSLFGRMLDQMIPRQDKVEYKRRNNPNSFMGMLKDYRRLRMG